MMPFKQPINNLFDSLVNVLQQIDNETYTQLQEGMPGNSIGKHVRHIIELYQCLLEQYNTGIINYDERKREEAIENNKDLAIAIFRELIEKIDKPDRSLVLHCNYSFAETPVNEVKTTYYRELVHNIEHTIHHMAFIRIGLVNISGISIADDFGVAISTLKYKIACAR